MRIIDFHNHYYPPEYVEALKSPASKSVVKVTYDADGNPCVHYPGDYNILVPGHRDIEYRQRVLDEHGVTTQLLTFTTPGVHVETPELAVAWARMVNDAFARVVRERAGRFAALATLPLNDPAASVAELERAMTTLGFPGAMVFSNVNHVALADERFEPLWRKAERARGGDLHPSDGSARRRGDARLLADAARRLPLRHDARSIEARVQRRGRTVPAHPVGADPHGRRDSVSG